MPTLRTITLNSGFDDTFEVSSVAWGEVERVRAFASIPSGKGVNASRTAHVLGATTLAYCLVGADDMERFAADLDGEGIPHRLVPVPGRTRHNLTLLSEDRVAAHMVGAGFQLPDQGPVKDLLDLAVADCRPADVVSCNGSVPAGAPARVWADAAVRLHRAGALVALDAQSDAMLAAVRTGAVGIATPNEEEIAAIPGAGDVPTALRMLAGFGVRYPVVTLGARGAAFLADGQVVRAQCPVASPRQAVGAGDAFLAGLCAALLRGQLDPAHLVAAGLAAAAWHVGGRVGEPSALLRRVTIT